MTLSIEQLWQKYSHDGVMTREAFERCTQETAMRAKIQFREAIQERIWDANYINKERKVVSIWADINDAFNSCKEVQP